MTDGGRLPASFIRYTLGLALAAIGAVAAVSGQDLGPALARPELWVLAGLTCAVELLPIRLVREQSVDSVTVSSAFALAILFAFGALPAMLVWMLAALVADASARLSPVKVLFNAAQYGLSMAAAALALRAAGAHAPLALEPRHLPAMLAASVALFAVNHVLAGVGVALVSRVRVVPFLGRDLGFLTWTAGCQLALAPLLLGAGGAMSAIGALPVLAIYLGGRQAAAAAHRASHDGLTGLPNRSWFERELDDALGQAGDDDAEVWVGLVDLDQFKAINDTFGHPCGDELLAAVAGRMRAAMAAEDTLARFGGDVFGLLLASGKDADDALRQAEKVLAALDEPIMLQGMSLPVAACLGLAGGSKRLEAPELLRRAEVALHRAKHGTVQMSVFTGSASAGPRLERTALAAALAEALDDGQVTVCFQIKAPLRPGTVPAAEALARWRHPELGNVDPAAFVAVAEQTGLIGRLTARVLDLALERCAGWWADGTPVRVAVNLSPKSLVDRSLPAMVAAALARHELPGDALQLEVTESMGVASLPASPVFDELRALGVTFAIDDFGTGYSSLAQLAHLPVEEIKIDRSFVLGMDADPQCEVIVRSIVSLAHSLGLRVTAEGVETPEVLARLRGFGCHYAQGYLFGQPSPDPAIGAVAPAPAAAAVAV